MGDILDSIVAFIVCTITVSVEKKDVYGRSLQVFKSRKFDKTQEDAATERLRWVYYIRTSLNKVTLFCV